MYSGWRDWQGARDVLSSKLANIALFICLLSLLEFTIVFVPKIIKRGSLCIREHVLQQKCFLSGIAEKGGGDPCPNFLPFFHHVTVPYILTSISCYVIHFQHQNHQKCQNYESQELDIDCAPFSIST